MNINIKTVFGGADNPPAFIGSKARAIRKELQNSFQGIEFPYLHEIDICLCFSGNVSKYYPASGIYQPRYFLPKSKLIVTVHFSADLWIGMETEDTKTFLQFYKKYLFDVSDIVEEKMKKHRLDFDKDVYAKAVEKVFSPLL